LSTAAGKISLACNYINGINIKPIPLDMQNEKELEKGE
jgi:hypothetical protein